MKLGPLYGTAWKQGPRWGAWFRLFGYGLCVSNQPPMFSERYGYTRPLRIGGVKIGGLKPERTEEPT